MGLSYTVSGDIASFRTPSRVPIESLKFHFLPKQAAGTPTPENPIPIEGWTGLNGHRCGKNLLNFNKNYVSNPYTLAGLTYTVHYNAKGDFQYINVKGAKTSNNAFFNLNYYSSNTSMDPGHYIVYGTIPGIVEFRVYEMNPNETLLLNTTTGIYDFETHEGSTASWMRLQIMTNEYIDVDVYPILMQYPGSAEPIPITFPVIGKNKFDPNTEWTIGSPYRYVPFYYGEHDFYMSFTVKDQSINTSDLYIGFSYFEPISSRVATAGYNWCIEKGVIKQNHTNRISQGASSDYYGMIGRYLFVYPNTDDAYNRLISKYDIQIEEGTSATAFESYSSDNIVYGGYVDPVEGKLVATYQRLILNGTNYSISNFGNSSYNGTEATNRGITIPRTGILTNQNLDVAKVASSILIPSNDSIWGNPNNYKWHFTIYNHSQLHICFDNNVVGITQDMDWTPRTQKIKEWLAENNIEVVLPLETPIEYYIAPQQLKAFLDYNNFWSDANDITEVTYTVTESADMLAIRKKAQSFNNYFQGELIFELNGDDPPVDGAWVDRISNMDYKLVGGASYDSVNKIYDFSGTGMAIHDVIYRDPFNLGHHFRIEWDIYFRRAGTTNGHFFDLGSLGSAYSALGIGLLAKSSSTITFNWKMLGNESNPFGSSGEIRTHPNTPVEDDTNYTHFVGFHEIIPWNDGYDRLRIMINNKIKRYETQIPKVEYTQWKTANNHFSVGSGVYNWDIDNSPNRHDSQYDCDVKIRSIKIYKYD